MQIGEASAVEKGGTVVFGGLPALDFSTCIRDMRESIKLYSVMDMERKGAYYVLGKCMKGLNQSGWEDQCKAARELPALTASDRLDDIDFKSKC